MDLQSWLTAAILVPAAVFGVIAVRAARRGTTTLGLDPRRRAPLEALAGAGFASGWLAVLSGAFWLLGRGSITPGDGEVVPLLGIAIYFLLLFVVEEIVFRALLMTGLGVVAGQTVALILTSVAVAVPYLASAGSGVLPVIGAVLTNLLNGLARWRTGRIWFGIGMRWVWNTGQVAIGYIVSGYALGSAPFVRQTLDGPDWLTGGVYGPEGGLVGLIVRLGMIATLVLLAARLYTPWLVGTPGHPKTPFGVSTRPRRTR